MVPIEIWMETVSALLSAAPLEMLHISSELGMITTDEIWSWIAAAHGKQLVRLSLQRIFISQVTLEIICRQCIALQEFLFSTKFENLVRYQSNIYHIIWF
jgi:hypothetical protein